MSSKIFSEVDLYIIFVLAKNKKGACIWHLTDKVWLKDFKEKFPNFKLPCVRTLRRHLAKLKREGLIQQLSKSNPPFYTFTEAVNVDFLDRKIYIKVYINKNNAKMAYHILLP